MKGIVFTVFLDMVDDKFGEHVTEEIIEASDLPTGGAYTSVGTYDHSEIVLLVTHLSRVTKIEITDLIRAFGNHLLGEFYKLYPHLFENINNVMDFLELVDGYIHSEVRKLYPDAVLPKITTQRISRDTMELVYQSDRMMGDLAEGLIAGAIKHFGSQHIFERADVKTEGVGQCVHFKVTSVSQMAA